jgi:hypothetical protein
MKCQHTLLPRFIFLFAIVQFLAGEMRYCAAEATHYATPGVQVDITSAVPLRGGDKPLFEIEMKYAFDGRNTVWLEGIGDLPAVGAIHYVVQDHTLIFREAKNGKIMATVPFERTDTPQGPDMGNPFPPSIIQGVGWRQDLPTMVLPATAPQVALMLPDILGNKARPQLSFTPCRPDDEGCILSEWVPITSPSEYMQVQIGLMLILSSSPGHPGETKIKVYYVGRQGLLGSKDYSYVLNSSSLSKCASAVRTFRNTISTNFHGSI